MKALVLLVPLLLATPAEAAGCRKFSIWNYPFPQHCPAVIAEAPKPPPRPVYLEVPGDPDIEFALPSLENMEFPPDCDAEWCQRLKGIGLLREAFGTN